MFVGHNPQIWGRYPCSSGAESEHMFQGEFSHTIDDKGRLTLPAKFRGELSAGLVVTRGLDHCLCIYTKNQWDEMSGNITRLPSAEDGARNFTRFMFSGANELEPDKQGRVLLPTYLRLYAHLGEEAVIVGAGERLEVWNPANWQKVMRDMEEHPEAVAKAMAEIQRIYNTRSGG
jgi:MraZ protein